MRLMPPKSLAILLSLVAGFAHADWQDPLGTQSLVAANPTGTRPDVMRPCFAVGPKLMSVADVIERALCNNPQTREVWAQARAQAALVGVAQSAFLPGVTVSATGQRRFANGTVDQTTAQATLNYLLFDSGLRSAQFESAHQLLVAANSRQENTLQQIFFQAAQAYYRWFALEAVAAASQAAEAAANESLKAARARFDAGVGTPADTLQAQTAASQAILNRIRADGDARSAHGVLANVIGVDANLPLHVEPPPQTLPSVQFDNDVDRLIDFAKRLRPDLIAARALVNAARSQVPAARAAGLPSINVSAGRGMNDFSSASPVFSNSLGVTLSIPVFTGYATTYRVQAARDDLDARLASRDTLDRQVSLDVWLAYQSLTTDTQSLRATADLRASAEEAYKVALGRYQAGVGTLIELLNAQSAQASAQAQSIEAHFNWHISRFSLGLAVGQLDFGMLDASQTRPQ